MLARRDDEAWSLESHEDRAYRSDEEKRFFEAVENPPEPTEELRELFRVYGKFVNRDC